MTPTPDNFFSVLGWLGIALCCGLPLLIFAAIAFYAARKHTQNMERINQAAPLKIATLTASNRLVRLQGIIKQVPQPIDGPDDSPLAVVRLKAEIYEQDDDGSGWRGAGDKLRATAFELEDETGTVLVDPQGLDKHSLGEGFVPSREDSESAAILTGIDPRFLNLESRARLWELRGGQRVTVIGAVSQHDGQLVVGKLKDNPFVITPLLGAEVQTQGQKQAKTGWAMTAILGIPGLLAICCGLAGALIALIRALLQP